ncbi:MAG: poly(R)-hydroxyalkanoic acid synthase subunit PhaE [Rhizobiaceae bacterium]
MANSDNAFEQMFDMWQQGQEAFMKAQRDAVDEFNRNFNSSAGAHPFTPGPEAMKTWQGFVNSWAPAWNPSAMMANSSADTLFGQGKDALHGMLDPSNWLNHAPEQLRKILDSIAQGPQFADLATPQVDAAEAWRESLDYQRAALDFSRILQEAWGRAFQKYSENFTLEDLQSGEVKEALDAWLKAANDELLETQRTPEFMDAQRRLMRAGVEIKARQRDTAEAWSDSWQMPTRTEVDDLAKIVHELRREVRKLKRELAALKVAKQK